MRRCDTCAAFKSSNVHMDPAKPDSPLYGECRAHAPVILARYNTPQGGTWQAGWPPTNSHEWCLQHKAKAALRPVGLVTEVDP